MKLNRLPKHLLSVATVVLFITLALASKVNKMHNNAFYYHNKVDSSEKGNYLLKHDGTKVFGDKIKWKGGLLSKEQVLIDDEKFLSKEIKGYFENGFFHKRFGNDFLKRIVHGKINVYVKFTEVSSHSVDRDGRTRYSHYTRADHYAQVGENGALTALGNEKDIQEMVKDCPLAVELASLKGSKMRKAIKKDRNYLNNIFETYNNGCKQVE